MSYDSDGEDVSSSPTRSSRELVAQAAQVVSSYVSCNHVIAGDIPALVLKVHATLAEIARARPAEPAKPPVPIKKSYGDDFIICLEDGKRLTMLKRYLHTHYGMTPEQYRAKWGLPIDYPMAAPAYARLRSAFAKKIGLGTRPTSRTRRRPKK